MSKLLFAIFVLITSLNVSAFNTEITWNDKYKKELRFYCSDNDYFCNDFCQSNKLCKVIEKPCRNCIGTSISLTYIFNYMGKAYTNTGVRKNISDVIELILTGEFVSFSSRSIFNHVDRFNSSSLKKNFRKVCNDGTMYPIVIFKRNISNNQVGEVDFVFCDSGVFEMTFGAQVIENLESDNLIF